MAGLIFNEMWQNFTDRIPFNPWAGKKENQLEVGMDPIYFKIGCLGIGNEIAAREPANNRTRDEPSYNQTYYVNYLKSNPKIYMTFGSKNKVSAEYYIKKTPWKSKGIELSGEARVHSNIKAIIKAEHNHGEENTVWKFQAEIFGEMLTQRYSYNTQEIYTAEIGKKFFLKTKLEEAKSLLKNKVPRQLLGKLPKKIELTNEFNCQLKYLHREKECILRIAMEYRLLKIDLLSVVGISELTFLQRSLPGISKLCFLHHDYVQL
ncbi:hypothetical protein TSUD_240080 [Trifolium subterraneum]|uniref:Uncharacterized protein n=1 Tax=Trifolium subterraneum TaxID=3900 RepID=A0A2Z6P7S5_TRISU|nr:hypothetical protein TSUD_240080 [Trifolium subterraneum]